MRLSIFSCEFVELSEDFSKTVCGLIKLNNLEYISINFVFLNYINSVETIILSQIIYLKTTWIDH